MNILAQVCIYSVNFSVIEYNLDLVADCPMPFMSRFFHPTPRSPSKADKDLLTAILMKNLDAAIQALSAGGDPTAPVQVHPYEKERTAFSKAIEQHQADMVGLFLDKGFKPRTSDVIRAVRSVQQLPDFDGHPQEMPEGNNVIRVLFEHGERFMISSHDPNHPTETLADNLRRHAPGLGLQWDAAALTIEPLTYSPEPSPATTESERATLNLQLGLIAHYQDLISLDEIRELLDRGADPLSVPREVGPTMTLPQIALASVETNLLKLCLARGLLPTAQDKAKLVHKLFQAIDENDERRTHGNRLSSTHAMIRVLLSHGEKFADLAPSPQHAGWTAAQIIRSRSPILAQEMDVSSPTSSMHQRFSQPR